MKELNLLFLKRIIAELKDKITFPLMYSVIKFNWLILFIYQIKKFEHCMDLLLMTDENMSHYVYVKYFNRFMCNKTKK